jgi:uncharacterized protein (DUF433 family)
MTIQLSMADREYLEQLASRKSRPTKRQKARIVLGLAAGELLDSISMRVGVTKEDLTALVAQFQAEGLEGIGLAPASPRDDATRTTRRLEVSPREGHRVEAFRVRHREDFRSGRWRDTTVEKTPGVCGGEARIAGTRIPVWQLVEARDLGAPEFQLLIDFPRLSAQNLVDAWAYAKEHAEEIAEAIHDNEVA